MDPLYYQVNQNRLLDNTQRSSDNLKAAAIKANKEKSKRTGEMDEEELSGDISSMGEDLLGSMDPDLFGKGGGTNAFKQMWEDLLNDEDEEEDEEESEEGEGEDDEDSPEPEGDQVEGEEGRKPLQAFQVEAPEQTAATGQAPAPEAPAAPAEAEKPKPQPEPGPPPPAAVLELSAEARNAPPEPVEAAEQLELTPPDRSVPSAKDAPSWSSLLDLTGGFLLAEETLPELSDDEEAAAEVEEAEAVCPDVAVLLEKLIVGDASTPAYRRLQLLLGRFGAGVIRTCLEQKSRVFLLPKGDRLSSHPQVAMNGMDDARGAVYLTDSRSCVVEEELLYTAPYGFHPVLYYFAHAFDHALGGEDFASLRSPAVGASFQACQQGGHLFADPLAATSPVHYFAQAVESYLNENDCYEPLWTRADLYDFDRSMFEYVDYLFKRANK